MTLLAVGLVIGALSFPIDYLIRRLSARRRARALDRELEELLSH